MASVTPPRTTPSTAPAPSAAGPRPDPVRPDPDRPDGGPSAPVPGRPMRADARRNRDRLVGEARTLFAEQGTDASLEDLARRAEVGIGTLYRHFPTRHALMNAVFQDALADLIAHSYALARAEQPCRALVEWLGAIVRHAGEYRGLAQALLSASRDDTSALAPCHVPLREAGARLLARAQRSGSVRTDVSIGDLMQLTNAIALAAEQNPEDPELPDRLLLLTLQGLKGRADTAPGSA